MRLANSNPDFAPVATKIVPRLTVQFSKHLDKILNELAEEDEITKVEVFRRALALYNYAHTEARKKGRKLSVTDDADHILKDIVF